MSTFLPDASTGTETAEYAGKTWSLDFDKKKVSGMIDGLNSCRQAATLAMNTPRYMHLIYSFSFGSELNTLIGHDFDFVQAAAPRLIRECLLQDDRVSDVKNFSFTKNGDSVSILFTVVTADGNFEKEVTV